MTSYYDYYEENDIYEECHDYDGSVLEFASPGSALRAVTPDNPRIFPCPTCGRENVLTRKDVDLRYQCDQCADRDEGHF
jgi:predicted RNA-binding Zn-ribbon protein involved in translation (DUF1610 family)